MMKYLCPALLLFTACTGAGLQPIDDQLLNVVDDKLEISGEICTEPPQQQPFPVKIMFIVDTSGSMQFTDPGDATASSCVSTCLLFGASASECDATCAGADNPGREAAVRKVVDRFKNNPAVSFSIIRFNSRVVVNASEGTDAGGFRSDPAILDQALAGLAEADVLTDYQGALAAALTTLEKDMVETSDALTRARTKYVIIFLSDGAPNPRCLEGCDNDFEDRSTGTSVASWCDLERADWCNRPGTDADGNPVVIAVFDPTQCAIVKESFPAMRDPCQSYNSPEDVIEQVNRIMELGQQYGVGSIQLNTAFLFVDDLPDAVKNAFDLDKDRSEGLLKDMARAGNGLYRAFTDGQKIDFLDINYSSVPRPYGMTNFIVSNTNARPGVTRLLVDSDGDGIDDSTEFEASMQGDNVDTDGDGYNDKLEYDRRNAGFDPLDPKVPVRVCPTTERIDRDGDGLLDCEESVLGTNPKLADSDLDRIPDFIEFQFGTNPLEQDAKVDIDFDGQLSDDEIAQHADPTISDPLMHTDFGYRYDLILQPDRVDLRRCWSFNVRGVRLVDTEQRSAAGTSGYNEIMVYFGEGPADDPRDPGIFKAACVRAQYVQQACEGEAGEDTLCGFKNPPNGKVELTQDNFYELDVFGNIREKMKTDSTLDPCAGVALP